MQNRDVEKDTHTAFIFLSIGKHFRTVANLFAQDIYIYMYFDIINDSKVLNIANDSSIIT